jgi:hypothetical protein
MLAADLLLIPLTPDVLALNKAPPLEAPASAALVVAVPKTRLNTVQARAKAKDMPTSLSRCQETTNRLVHSR